MSKKLGFALSGLMLAMVAGTALRDPLIISPKRNHV